MRAPLRRHCTGPRHTSMASQRSHARCGNGLQRSAAFLKVERQPRLELQLQPPTCQRHGEPPYFPGSPARRAVMACVSGVSAPLQRGQQRWRSGGCGEVASVGGGEDGGPDAGGVLQLLLRAAAVGAAGPRKV